MQILEPGNEPWSRFISGQTQLSQSLLIYSENHLFKKKKSNKPGCLWTFLFGLWNLKQINFQCFTCLPSKTGAPTPTFLSICPHREEDCPEEGVCPHLLCVCAPSYSFRTFKSQPQKHPESLQELAEHHTGNWPSRHVRSDAVVRIPEETIRRGRGIGVEGDGEQAITREKERDPTSARNFRGWAATLPRPHTDCQAQIYFLSWLMTTALSHLQVHIWINPPTRKCYLKQQTADER